MWAGICGEQRCWWMSQEVASLPPHKRLSHKKPQAFISLWILSLLLCTCECCEFWSMHDWYFKSDSLETLRLRVSSCFMINISHLNRHVSVLTFEAVLCFQGALVWMTDLFWILQLSCNSCSLMESTLEKNSSYPSHFIIGRSKVGISSTQGTLIL